MYVCHPTCTCAAVRMPKKSHGHQACRQVLLFRQSDFVGAVSHRVTLRHDTSPHHTTHTTTVNLAHLLWAGCRERREQRCAMSSASSAAAAAMQLPARTRSPSRRSWQCNGHDCSRDIKPAVCVRGVFKRRQKGF